MGNEDFPQIKRDLVNKVNAIKTHIDEETLQREEIRSLLQKVNRSIFGDPMANPPIEGYHSRLERLESDRKERLKIKDNAVNLAVGSATIAIGGAIIWIFTVLKEAFMKGH